MDIPVTRYQAKGQPDKGSPSIHEELGFHFDWLWENAAVPLEEYTVGCSRGIDLAVHEAGISNVYYDPDLTKRRILQLIKDKQNTRVWIKGISLHSFFQLGDLFEALAIATRCGVDVKVLLIDPDQEQAKIRSFREFQIDRPNAAWESFSEDERRKQRLYRDTTESIQRIEWFIEEIQGDQSLHFDARLFSSGPEAFVMLTDSAVLIEQYHYGKIKLQDKDSMTGGRILGNDVPVIEYRRQAPWRNPLKDPYRIFEDHFRFVLKMSRSIKKS